MRLGVWWPRLHSPAKEVYQPTWSFYCRSLLYPVQFQRIVPEPFKRHYQPSHVLAFHFCASISAFTGIHQRYNTCYMASIVAVLQHIRPLKTLLDLPDSDFIRHARINHDQSQVVALGLCHALVWIWWRLGYWEERIILTTCVLFTFSGMFIPWRKGSDTYANRK